MSVMGTGQEIKRNHVKLVMEQDMKNKAIKYLSRFSSVETGQQIRLAGQRVKLANGGPYGDLFVINVNPSDQFTRDGSTIYYTLNISFVSQAALGDIEVPTVHGNIGDDHPSRNSNRARNFSV